MLTLSPTFWCVFVLLVSTIALGVVRLVLSSGPTVLTLLYWTAFRRDEEEFAVYIDKCE
jgi:hypothetical protein